VNNAGRAHEAVFALTPVDRFIEQMNANFYSAVMCSQAAIRLMMRRRHGVIVNISSSSALRCPVGLSAYASSKAALNCLTKTMARELTPFGIRVNGVAPSWTDTEMLTQRRELAEKGAKNTILGRLVKTEEVAAIVSSLTRDEMSGVSGQILQFEGGL
jgi:3-oxoacyl-[acyl-carrier protein] reductase